MRIVGIDSGKTGALALFIEGFPTAVMDMPLTVGGVDGAAVFRQLKLWQVDEVYIESTHAMPTNGSKAVFSQGDSNGALRTAVHIAQVPLIWVRPLDWQRSAGLGTSGRSPGGHKKNRLTVFERKRRSRMRAIELFPGISDELDRAKDHNRAEALLIGRFGVKTSITQVLIDG